MKYRHFNLASIFTLFVLVSCNGGGGAGGAGGSVGSVLSGVAAIGAPLVDADVTVFGKACQAMDKTDANGQYSVALSNCEGPYLLRAQNGTATVHSIASSSDFGKSVSITPITELVAGRALGRNDLSVLDANDINAENISPSDILEAKNEIKSALSSIFSEEGLDDFDLINTSFSPNGLGFDKILDAIDVAPSAVGNTFSFKIKGTDVEVDFSMDDSAEVASSAAIQDISDASGKISVTGEYLNEIRARINALNVFLQSSPLEPERKNTVLSYFDDNFLHGGLPKEADPMDPYAVSVYEKFFSADNIELSNPVLLGYEVKEDSSIVADVFIDVKEYEQEDSGLEVSGNFKAYMRFKKIGDKWYFYGDQMPFEVEISSLNLKLNNTFYRGLLIDLDTDSVGSVINISSSLFTTGLSIDGQLADIQESSLKIGCTHDADYCKSFLKLSDSASLPNFLKVNVSIGSSSFYTYTTTPKIINSADSFPSFTNIPEGGMCGEFDSTSYPASVGFSIPADHLGLEYIEANSLVNGASGLTHDLYSSNQSYEETSSFVTNEFSQNFSPYTGPVSVDKFNMSISSANAFGQYVRTVYSCGP